MVSRKEVLRIMKKRLRNLKRRMKEEENKISRLAHKSRHVRLSSPSGPRKMWFLDRAQELELAIELLEGKWEEADYVKRLAGDKLDKMLSGFYG